MIPQNELTAHDVRQMMQETAQEHLPLSAAGYKSSSEMRYDVLMKAASEGISIDGACRDLEETVGANTLRTLLNEQVTKEQLDEQETALNAALAARLPPQSQAYGVAAAIDEPCYGKRDELLEYTCGGRAKAGTLRFFRIVTLYVI